MVIAGVLRVCWLFWKKSKVHITFRDKLIVGTEIMKRIINVGIPSFLENAIMQGGFLVGQIILVSIGTLEIAAYQVGTNIQAMSFLPIMAFAEPLSSLYSSDPEVIKAGTIVVRGFALIEPFMGLEKVGAAVMRPAGDIRYVIITGIIAMWSLRITVPYLLTHYLHLGLYGVMIGIFLDFSARATMYMTRMRNGYWKYLKI